MRNKHGDGKDERVLSFDICWPMMDRSGYGNKGIDTTIVISKLACGVCGCVFGEFSVVPL